MSSRLVVEHHRGVVTGSMHRITSSGEVHLTTTTEAVSSTAVTSNTMETHVVIRHHTTRTSSKEDIVAVTTVVALAPASVDHHHHRENVVGMGADARNHVDVHDRVNLDTVTVDSDQERDRLAVQTFHHVTVTDRERSHATIPRRGGTWLMQCTWSQ